MKTIINVKDVSEVSGGPIHPDRTVDITISMKDGTLLGPYNVPFVALHKFDYSDSIIDINDLTNPRGMYKTIHSIIHSIYKQLVSWGIRRG